MLPDVLFVGFERALYNYIGSGSSSESAMLHHHVSTVVQNGQTKLLSFPVWEKLITLLAAAVAAALSLLLHH